MQSKASFLPCMRLRVCQVVSVGDLQGLGRLPIRAVSWPKAPRIFGLGLTPTGFNAYRVQCACCQESCLLDSRKSCLHMTAVACSQYKLAPLLSMAICSSGGRRYCLGYITPCIRRLACSDGIQLHIHCVNVIGSTGSLQGFFLILPELCTV